MQILCCCYNKCLLLPLGVAVFQYLYLYFLAEQPRGVCALSNLSSKFVWFPFKANCIAHPGPACLLVVSTMSHDGQLMSDSYYAEFLLSHLKECCRTSFFSISGFSRVIMWRWISASGSTQSKLISGQHILKDSICFDSWVQWGKVNDYWKTDLTLSGIPLSFTAEMTLVFISVLDIIASTFFLHLVSPYAESSKRHQIFPWALCTMTQRNIKPILFLQLCILMCLAHLGFCNSTSNIVVLTGSSI